MVDRARCRRRAAARRQPERRGQPGLGLGHRLREVTPGGEARGDRRRQAAAGPMRVAGHDARLLEPDLARRRVEQVGARVRSRWPPFSSTLAGPRARRAAAAASISARVAGAGRPSRAPASGRLGVIRSASGRSRVRRRATASGSQQAVAALGDHHRVEDDVGRPPRGETLGHGRDDLDAAEHPELDRIDPQVAEHGVHLLPHECGIDGVDRLHPQRVLGGQRGDDRGAVDAECGEGLEIGLDAGAATAVGAGDGQRDGDAAPRLPRAALAACLPRTSAARDRGVPGRGLTSQIPSPV